MDSDAIEYYRRIDRFGYVVWVYLNRDYRFVPIGITPYTHCINIETAIRIIEDCKAHGRWLPPDHQSAYDIEYHYYSCKRRAFSNDRIGLDNRIVHYLALRNSGNLPETKE
jgi:hypothetical protein